MGQNILRIYLCPAAFVHGPSPESCDVLCADVRNAEITIKQSGQTRDFNDSNIRSYICFLFSSVNHDL